MNDCGPGTAPKHYPYSCETLQENPNMILKSYATEGRLCTPNHQRMPLKYQR